MYEGDGVYDEVRQNAYDQQHPDQSEPLLTARMEVATTRPMVVARPEIVIGLSKRQMDLINNVDVGQAETGAARERRLETIYTDIASINQFLPYMDQIRGFMSTMPHDDNEDLIEALRMADLKLKQFITEIQTKLASLEYELELKKVVV